MAFSIWKTITKTLNFTYESIKKGRPMGRPGAVILRFTLLIDNYDGHNVG